MTVGPKSNFFKNFRLLTLSHYFRHFSCVAIARPQQIKEGWGRPIWSDDNWIKKYGTGTKDEDGNILDAEGNIVNNPEEEALKAAEMSVVEAAAAMPEARPRVFFDIKIGANFAGRIVLELQVVVKMGEIS